MTFSAKVKAELCQPRVERKCCAIAEAYGVLLYCHTFSPSEIRITTSLLHLMKMAHTDWIAITQSVKKSGQKAHGQLTQRVSGLQQ